ncbi:MAG: hypothetical protein AVDCRST_MAG01-01-2049, partial [uncultured Rubrobacteraceae bacterium]
ACRRCRTRTEVFLPLETVGGDLATLAEEDERIGRVPPLFI